LIYLGGLLFNMIIVLKNRKSIVFRHEAAHLWFLWMAMKNYYGFEKALDLFKQMDPSITWTPGADAWIHTSLKPIDLKEWPKEIDIPYTLGGPVAEIYYDPRYERGLRSKIRYQIGTKGCENKDFAYLHRLYGFDVDELEQAVKEGKSWIKEGNGEEFIERIYSEFVDKNVNGGEVKILPLIIDLLSN